MTTEKPPSTAKNEKEEKTNPTHKEKTSGSTAEKAATHEQPQHDAYIRLLAEFENFKKRTQKEQHYWLDRIKERIVSNLLPILDDFGRALSHDTPAQANDQQGVMLLHKKLYQTLEKEGLKTMNVEVGAAFDANLHEALSTLPNQDPTKKDTIAQIVLPGYLLDEKIIRFAQVIVYSS